MSKIAETMQVIWLDNKEQGLPIEQTLEDITAYLQHATLEEKQQAAEGFRVLAAYVKSLGDQS